MNLEGLNIGLTYYDYLDKMYLANLKQGILSQSPAFFEVVVCRENAINVSQYNGFGWRVLHKAK